jgi:hypothetical protein
MNTVGTPVLKASNVFYFTPIHDNVVQKPGKGDGLLNLGPNMAAIVIVE